MRYTCLEQTCSKYSFIINCFFATLLIFRARILSKLFKLSIKFQSLKKIVLVLLVDSMPRLKNIYGEISFFSCAYTSDLVSASTFNVCSFGWCLFAFFLMVFKSNALA